MENFKKSVILLGIDWDKSAKRIANLELKADNKELYHMIVYLDDYFNKLR